MGTHSFDSEIDMVHEDDKNESGENEKEFFNLEDFLYLPSWLHPTEDPN